MATLTTSTQALASQNQWTQVWELSPHPTKFLVLEWYSSIVFIVTREYFTYFGCLSSHMNTQKPNTWNSISIQTNYKFPNFLFWKKYIYVFFFLRESGRAAGERHSNWLLPSHPDQGWG